MLFRVGTLGPAIRYGLPAALMLIAMQPVAAQDVFSPAKGVCGVINFRFCDQGESSVPPASSGLPPGALPPPPLAPDAADAMAPRSLKKNAAKTAKAKATGNCGTGVFTTASGERFQFIGVAKRRLEGDPRYVILHDGLRMQDNTLSGYRDALVQFKTLCPGRVSRLDD